MLDLTQDQLECAGYELKAARDNAWRIYDEQQPVPGYFEFDWLSARHPDLYHQFALSSVGLVNELATLVDLTGLAVVDIGAGTGRITQGIARQAQRVTAVDAYAAVVRYGRGLLQQAGFTNVDYVRGENAHLPLPDNAMDAAVCAWAAIDYPEAYRVLKPGGYLIDLGPAPGALCGELTATLVEVYPKLITEVASAQHYAASCPTSDFVLEEDTWNGIPVMRPVRVHEFTYVADYGASVEAAAILGRLYGPRAKHYLLDRQQATLAWRLRIVINRVWKASA